MWAHWLHNEQPTIPKPEPKPLPWFVPLSLIPTVLVFDEAAFARPPPVVD